MNINLQEIIEDLQLDLPNASSKKLILLCKKAANQINNYLNANLQAEQIYIQYQYAVEQIVLDTYNYQNSEQFKSGAIAVKEGNSSIQYAPLSALKGRMVFTDEVKSMLPNPFLVMMG